MKHNERNADIKERINIIRIYTILVSGPAGKKVQICMRGSKYLFG